MMFPEDKPLKNFEAASYNCEVMKASRASPYFGKLRAKSPVYGAREPNAL
jgi:hypothetical protein